MARKSRESAGDDEVASESFDDASSSTNTDQDVTEGEGQAPESSGDAVDAEAPGETVGAAGTAESESGAEAESDADPQAEAGAATLDGEPEVVERDLEKLTEQAARADEYLTLAKRTQADFENYRKRAARDGALAQQRGIGRLAKELLPAIDNLERALTAATDSEDPLAEGIGLVKTEILSALNRVGIESFAPAGEQFDPTVHEAVAQNAVEGVETGTVIEVFQPGYRLGETVLRPARVLVAA